MADGTAILREFRFHDFYRTMSFVNALAHIANIEDHHPDLEVGYNYCRVRYTTHAIGGLSENDFICAARSTRFRPAERAYKHASRAPRPCSDAPWSGSGPPARRESPGGSGRHRLSPTIAENALSRSFAAERARPATPADGTLAGACVGAVPRADVLARGSRSASRAKPPADGLRRVASRRALRERRHQLQAARARASRGSSPLSPSARSMNARRGEGAAVDARRAPAAPASHARPRAAEKQVLNRLIAASISEIVRAALPARSREDAQCARVLARATASATASHSAAASSNPRFTPWPASGCTTCAASPISAQRGRT